MKLDPKEFIDWIKKQPDDKQVNMRECFRDDPCGCLLVQFGKHKKLKFTRVGLWTIGNNEFPEVNDVGQFVSKAWNNHITTFKQAKDLISQIS